MSDIKSTDSKQWEDLRQCSKQLADKDYKHACSYVSHECASEVKELIEAFKLDFADVPDDNALRLETLCFLGKLGVIITR